ncbi:MAG: hypothetical protein OXF41_22415 [bacterium]|nr:hypothetical protein [bacterium]
MPGPFEIGARAVSRLDAGFAVAVNRLLEAEAARAGMVASSLVLNSVDELADGGVDAAIHDAPAGGDWIPKGDSVWQFKRSDLQPAECADEFGGASWAYGCVQSGGTYVLVIGVARTDQMKQRRRDAILGKAEDLDLGLDSSQVRVYDANDLARWICLFPSLVIATVTGDRVRAAVDFATWADTRLGRMVWVAEEPRQNTIETIRAALSEPVAVDLRVEGASGIGKSRLVLEAVRSAEYAPLVAYVADEAEMASETLQYITGLGRTVVLVVDQCPADRHWGLAQRLPNDPRVKLVTVGPSGHAVTPRQVLAVEPMSREGIDKLLSLNFPGLSDVNRRVVVEIAGGSPQIAEIRAEQASYPNRRRSAPGLITESDIREFLTDQPIRGLTLDVAESVALFEKLGWDDELAPERDLVAEFLGLSTSDVEACGYELEQAGWLTVRGRYRSISAHRLAIYLASRKWEKDGDRIVGEFLDRLSAPMGLALFRRLADLGRYQPAQQALASLLAGDGPFGSFAQLRTPDRATLLTPLAIVLPNEVSLHISELLEGVSEETLRAHPAVCRELVWALEKLAWHTDTFRWAAASLLRLAVADHRPGGDQTLNLISAASRNNAEPKWTTLFGTMLPATAASTAARMEYLKRVARSEDPRERVLAVIAFEQAAARRESVMVSAELQGGSLVEDRGTPATWGLAWAYQVEAIKELGVLANDPNPEVRSAAEDYLIGAINTLAGTGKRWKALEDVLVDAAPLHGRVRHQLQSLEAIYRRARSVDDSDEREHDRQIKTADLASLGDRLPTQNIRDALQLALTKPRWEHPVDRIEQEVVDAMAGFLADHSEAALFEFLGRSQPNAGEFGTGLLSLPSVQPDTALEGLVAAYAVNPEALLGYLHRRRETDGPHVVEAFLDSLLAMSMPDIARLEVARVGQPTEGTLEIVDELVARLPVAETAMRVQVTPRVLPEMLQRWSARLETQQDYNMLVKRLSYELRGNESVLESIASGVLEVVLRRLDFPETGQASWNWGHLGKAVLEGNEQPLVELVLDMAELPGVVLSMGSGEAPELLRAALQQRTDLVWAHIGDRLESGSQRVSSYLEQWDLLVGIEPAPIQEWIGANVSRARIVARIASLGEDEPTPVTRHLLATFGNDEHITSVLKLKLDCELQVGRKSEHFQRQIDRLGPWRKNLAEPSGVRRWARDRIAEITALMIRAIRQEEERGW